MRDPRDNTVAVIIICVLITIIAGISVFLVTAPAL